MGTPAYMSPEQLSGRTLDHRTDLFSLGVVLYQMASGRRPFDGASSIKLASAILRDTPPLVTDLRADVPTGFARLIQRCLEKDPRQRVQTAREVADECRNLASDASPTGTAGAAPRSSSAGAQPMTAADEAFWILVRPSDEVTAADVVRVAAAAHHHRLRASLPVEDGNLCSLDAARNGHYSEKHRSPTRQRLRPQVIGIAACAVGSGQDRRRPACWRHLLQACRGRVRRKHDRVIRCPGSSPIPDSGVWAARSEQSD